MIDCTLDFEEMPAKILPCAMKPFTLKQRAVCFVIRIIESVVNSRSLVGILNAVSTKLQKRMLFGGSVARGQSSMFRNLSVAFIPDGNRRWHKRQGAMRPVSEKSNACSEKSCTRSRLADSAAGLKSTSKVRAGADKISEIIKFAYFNNFREVSFFCFSLKNFRRSRSEVDDIMGHIKKYRMFDYSIPIRVQVYGKLEMLDPQVRETLEQYVEKTRSINGMVVNIFVGYTSSDDEKSPRKFNRDVDLLIRTSGERRLSDFMVSQVARGTAVDFVDPYWPEFSLAHLWLVCFKYVLEEKYLKD